MAENRFAKYDNGGAPSGAAAPVPTNRFAKYGSGAPAPSSPPPAGQGIVTPPASTSGHIFGGSQQGSQQDVMGIASPAGHQSAEKAKQWVAAPTAAPTSPVDFAMRVVPHSAAKAAVAAYQAPIEMAARVVGPLAKAVGGIMAGRMPSPQMIGNVPNPHADTAATPTGPVLSNIAEGAWGATKGAGQDIADIGKFFGTKAGVIAPDEQGNLNPTINPLTGVSRVWHEATTDPVGTAFAFEGIKGGVKAVKSGVDAIKARPSRYEKEAGKFFMDQLPKDGSALAEKVAGSQDRAQALEADTGAKFTLDQQTGLDSLVADKKALKSRDGNDAMNQDQQFRDENLALVEKMVKGAGGDAGNIHDVIDGLTNALSQRKDEVFAAETDLAGATEAQKIEYQKRVGDLYKIQNHLESALQKATDTHENNLTSRNKLVDDTNQATNDVGKSMLAGAVEMDVSGQGGRAATKARKDAMKKEANDNYDQITPFHGVEVPDVSSTMSMLNQVKKEHPNAFKFTKDSADTVAESIIKRMSPAEEGGHAHGGTPGEAPLEPFREFVDLGEGGTGPTPPEVKPLTIGELDTVSRWVSKKAREANAGDAPNADLARRLLEIKDGISEDMGRLDHQGNKGQFEEKNTMDAKEWAQTAEGMRKNQFFSVSKKGKKFATDSDFSAHMRQNYPTVAGYGYPKDVILAAVDRAANGTFGKMTDAQKKIIDGMNRDNTQNGAAPKGVALDKSLTELIAHANGYYKNEFVPAWRASLSPARKVLSKDSANTYRVADEAVMEKYLEGTTSGKMYKKVFGEDSSHAKDFSTKELLDTAFDGEQWSAPKAYGWLRKRKDALQQIGIYKEMSEHVEMVKQAADLAKEPDMQKFLGESRAAKDKAATDLANFKAKVGKPESAVTPANPANLPETRVLQARQQALSFLEKSPVGKMLNGDAETTMNRLVAAAKSNGRDAVKLINSTLEGNKTAQAGFKSAFLDYLYNEMVSDASKGMDLEKTPMPGKMARAVDKLNPFIDELLDAGEKKSISNAKEIVDTMARSNKNVVSGSETNLFGNRARYQNMSRAFAMLAMVKTPFIHFAVGRWVGDGLAKHMQSNFDAVLTKIHFDPAYAAKLAEIAKESEKGSVKATARKIAKGIMSPLKAGEDQILSDDAKIPTSTRRR